MCTIIHYTNKAIAHTIQQNITPTALRSRKCSSTRLGTWLFSGNSQARFLPDNWSYRTKFNIPKNQENGDSKDQGPSLLKNFGGDKPYCLRFDDVNMFTQPWYDLSVKLAKW